MSDDRVTATPTADLLAYARERGVRLSRQGAQRLLRQRGPERARERLDAMAALIDLASALGEPLTALGAARRLDAAGGDVEVARERMVARDRARRSGIFSRVWSEAEDRFWARDARARHAVFVAEVAAGALGWQATMLLLAADDAGLRDPSADAYREHLARIVAAEIDRRYPVRREEEWQVLDLDSRHSMLLQREAERERQARMLALARRPELRHRIDYFAGSPSLRRDIERVLREIRQRLSACAAEGWLPNPEHYRRAVIDLAAGAAMTA